MNKMSDHMTFTKVVIDGNCEKGSIIKGIPRWAADKDIAKKGCRIKPRNNNNNNNNSEANGAVNIRQQQMSKKGVDQIQQSHPQTFKVR